MMQLDKKEIGKRIQTARNQSHFTQGSLSEQLGISLTHMSAIENGYSGASVPLMAHISLLLNVSIDKLLFGSIGEQNAELAVLLSDCSQDEVQLFTAILKSIKGELKNIRHKSY